MELSTTSKSLKPATARMAQRYMAIQRAEGHTPAKRSPLRALVLSQFIVLLIMLVFGDVESTVNSLFTTSLASFAGVIAMYVLYLRRLLGQSTLQIILGAFLLRLTVGISHYLLIIDPNYFNYSGEFTYLWDYEWMHHSMIFVKDHWSVEGFFSPLPLDYLIENKNAYLNAYNALLYYLNGTYVLNIAPWNSLHSIYTACIVVALAQRAGASRNQMILALAIAAFQPFGFISSIFWRDTVGQLFVAVAIYILVSTKDKLQWWVVLLPVAGFLAFSQRQPYLLVILMGAALIYVKQVQATAPRIIVGIFSISLFIYLSFGTNLVDNITYVSVGAYQGPTYSYADPVKWVEFPMRLLRGLIGPFPWYQVFFVEHAEYMPADFLQHVLNVTIYIVAFPIAIKLWKNYRHVDPSMVFGIGLLLSGITASGIHSGYVSIGSIFFLPIACQSERSQWLKTMGPVMGFFLLANLLYWALGLTGSNISGVG